MLFFRRVVGDSMLPALHSGQVVLVSYFRKPRIGSVVVAIQNKREVIKRIHAIADNGGIELRGDNPDASTDSRQLGTIPARHIMGVVIWPRCDHNKRRRRSHT